MGLDGDPRELHDAGLSRLGPLVGGRVEASDRRPCHIDALIGTGEREERVEERCAAMVSVPFEPVATVEHAVDLLVAADGQAEVEDGGREAFVGLVAQCPGRVDRSTEINEHTSQIAGVDLDRTPYEQRQPLRPRAGDIGTVDQRRAHPHHRQVALEQSEIRQEHRRCGGGVVDREEVIERGPDVLLVGNQPIAQGRECRRAATGVEQYELGLEEPCVAVADRPLIGEVDRHETTGELGHCLEHPKARTAVRVLDLDEAVVDQPVEGVEHGIDGQSVVGGDRLGGVERPAVHEHRDAAEEQPLRVVE